LALNDARRFGSVDLWPGDALDAYPPFAALGPEPLGNALTAQHLAAAFAGRITSIKQLLLDQRIVAGLGNIYVCEALHEARISPRRAAGQVATARLARLVPAIRNVLCAAIEAGGSSLRDYARPDGELGYFSKQFKVYGREGEVCACGGIVARYVEGGRSTFWCPRCQR
jgi:formamidopyrimidine-DNA glycosylase